MTDGAERIFRASALQRAASPEQLDHLVGVTKPVDWILTSVICLVLAGAIGWGILGRVPQIHTGPPGVATPFEVHRQFSCNLPCAFAVARRLPFGNFSMQDGSAARGDPVVQHVAVQNMIELKARAAAPHEPVLPLKLRERSFDIVGGESRSARDRRDRKGSARNAGYL